MSTYIISDLHLSEDNPVLTKAFASFYRKLMLNDKLIIAGDLFDFFVGLDPSDKLQQQVAQIIKEAGARGVQTYFQVGNRDFLIDKKAADFMGMKLLPDLYTIPTKGGKALLMHGDELCMFDKNFRRYRNLTKNRLVLFLFKLLLPLSIKRKIGAALRKKSKAQESLRELDANKIKLIHEAATRYLQATGCSILIHGHFHIYGAHNNEFESCTLRLSLGSWGKFYSYVIVDRTRFNLAQNHLEKLF